MQSLGEKECMDTYKIDGISIAHNITKHHTSPFHRHEGYELYLFLDGNVNFYTEQSCIELRRGYLLPIKLGNWHRAMTISDHDYDRMYINFTETFGKTITTEQTDILTIFKEKNKVYQSAISLDDRQLQEVIQLFTELDYALSHREFGYDLRIRAIMIQLLLKLYDLEQKKQEITEEPLPQMILNILQFIDQNLVQDLSVKRFAEAFYMSGPYLSRYFKKVMGVTMQEYIISKRIELAKKSLLEDKSIEQVCETCGFGNYYHFIRTFKQRTGISPGHYKKLKKEVN